MARRKYHVTVLMTKRVQLERPIWAESEYEALERGGEIVAAWADVESAEGVEAEEE